MRGEPLIGTGKADRERRNLTGQETKLRVAAYIRVSTDFSCQEDSFEQQERYFTNRIRNLPEWEYAGIYSDYGISGTSKEQRLGFLRLLRHCEEGKIDRILCKSISRFTRNTQDLLEAVRILQRNRISICFEKENLDTAEPVNEFVLTTLAALAQEESRSMSENMKTGIRMRFSQGEVLFQPIYGYRVYKSRDSNGNLIRDIVIEPQEAQIVRYIYRSVIEGKTYTEIARTLNSQLVVYPCRRNTVRGRKDGKPSADYGWTGERVASIVKNERYTGDAICQKTTKEDLFTHHDVKNAGQLPKYQVRNNHPAIISREEYQMVQEILANRRHGKSETAKYWFSGRIICGRCGRIYHLRSNREFRVWQCPCTTMNSHSRLICDEPGIYEFQLQRAVRKGFAERSGLIRLLEKGRMTEAGTGGFLEQIMNGLEQQAVYEWSEEEYNCVRRRYDAARQLDRHYGKRLRDVEAVIRAGTTRQESMEQLFMAEGKCRSACDKSAGELNAVWKDVRSCEQYRSEMERDYPKRRAAIAWIRELSLDRYGVEALLSGIAGEHLQAFVLQITVENLCSFRIRWYDNQTTHVQLEDCPENVARIREMMAQGFVW